jgi:hypothetical protein
MKLFAKNHSFSFPYIVDETAPGTKTKCAPGHLSKLFAETLFDCPVYRNYGQAIADQV